MIKEVDFLSSVGEACGAPPLFVFINMLGLPCPKKGNKMSYILTPNGRRSMVTESAQLDEVGDTPAGKKALIRYVKKAGGTSLDSAAALALDGNRKKAKIRAKSVERAADRLAKEEVEVDVDHFVEYVMENFPELTEMYIRENYIEEATGKTLKDYPHLHKHVVEKQKKDKLPASHTRDVGNVAVHARNQAAHSRADSALASGDAIAKRRAADVYRDHYGYEGSSERITSQRTKKD